MKATDLMIGDLVYIHEPECKGHRIDSIDELDGQVGADGEVYDECDIRPIPLTEEILENNTTTVVGFTGTLYWFSLDMCYVKSYGDYFWFSFQKGVNLVGLKLNYVHELQHLLRLCGIEKEVEL